MKKKFVLLFLLVLMICILPACKKNNKTQLEETSGNVTLVPTVDATKPPTATPTATPEPTQPATPLTYAGPLKDTMRKEDYPVVDGSTATIPLSEAVYMLATGASYEEAARDIVHTKTSNSYYRLMNKEADLLIVYAPSEQVIKDIEARGNPLDIKPIGKDALVFMANASNPVESLTHEQLIDIYSGKLTNWTDLGGEDKEILAFQRPENSGSQTLMLKLVMGDTPMVSGPSIKVYTEMEGILEAMVDYTNEGNTLGYSVFYYAQNMYQLPELRFMKVNGVEPSQQTIYDNTYPYINEFYAVIRKEEPGDSKARKIFDWLTEQEGQTLIGDLGYVPVNMEVKENPGTPELLREDEIPEGHRFIAASYNTDSQIYSGTITIYGGKWKKEKVIHNASLQSKVGLLGEENNIILSYAIKQEDGNFATRYGIFNLQKNDFMVPPEYDYIYQFDEEKEHYILNKDGKSVIIDGTGKEYLSSSYNEGFQIYKRGDYYWLDDYSKEGVIRNIYDLEFRLIREIYDVNGTSLYEPDGTLIMSKEMFMEHFGFLEAPNDEFWFQGNDMSPLIVVHYNRTTYVMDRQWNLLVQKPDPQEWYAYFSVYDDFYYESQYDSVHGIETGSFYDLEGNLITDTDGFAYTSETFIVKDEYTFSDHILYGVSENILRLYRLDQGSRFRIDLGDWNSVTVSHIKDDIITVHKTVGAEKTRIYKGEKLLYEFSGAYYPHYFGYGREFDSGIVLSYYDYRKNGATYLILDENGQLLYESPGSENIISVDQKYIQLERGNYWGVLDFSGNFILKGIRSNMTND